MLAMIAVTPSWAGLGSNSDNSDDDQNNNLRSLTGGKWRITQAVPSRWGCEESFIAVIT
jgi:hypothetical protein